MWVVVENEMMMVFEVGGKLKMTSAELSADGSGRWPAVVVVL